jgi:hypothetical protein
VWIYKGEVLKGEVGAAKKKIESMKREVRDTRKPRGEKRFDNRNNDRFRTDRAGNREQRVRNASDGAAPATRTDYRESKGQARPQTTAGAPAPAPAVAPKNEGGTE